MTTKTPKRLPLMIALPMLLMLGGTSGFASRVELQPSTSQPQPFSDSESEDSTLTVPVNFPSPEVFYDRTPCKLYGKC